MLKDLLLKDRSYRRFDESYEISKSTLTELIDLARITPSTVNSQPLRFMLINTPEENAKVFSTLAWAGLLKDWGGPKEGERPSAYIIILCDISVGKGKQFDEGIASHTILLGATEKGLGGCILGAINKEKLYDLMNIDSKKYEIGLVVALGKPNETVLIKDIDLGESTAYYRDESDSHCVPKIKTEDLIIREK